MATYDLNNLTHRDVEEMLLAVNGRIIGLDTDDNEYDSILPIWEKELKPTVVYSGEVADAEKNASGTAWYKKAFDYWENERNCPITDDGVLGGYGKLTPMDTVGSNAFLDRLLVARPGLQLNRVADCGAGIGRVTKNLLLPRCRVVDLVEQSPRLLAAAPAYLSSKPPLANAAGSVFTGVHSAASESEDIAGRVNLVNVGLQDFAPAPGTYDLIWIQWVIGHLHDLDCVRFFRRCAAGLTDAGVIVLKDNVLLQDDLTFLWDRSDSSVARHKRYYKLLLSLAGLQVMQETQQSDFPEELFPVMMWAICSAPRKIAMTSEAGSA